MAAAIAAPRAPGSPASDTVTGTPRPSAKICAHFGDRAPPPATVAREKCALRGSLESPFLGAFPTAQVVVEPMLQVNRQVAGLRARSGQTGHEDFVPLLARFSQALGGSAPDALAAVEFRDGRLKVRFQPQRVDGRAAREQLRDACARAGLRLQFDNERDPTATVGLQT